MAFGFSFCSCSSENYGKSFQDVTDLINNTFIQTEFGIAIGPEKSGKVRICNENVIAVKLAFICILISIKIILIHFYYYFQTLCFSMCEAIIAVWIQLRYIQKIWFYLLFKPYVNQGLGLTVSFGHLCAVKSKLVNTLAHSSCVFAQVILTGDVTGTLGSRIFLSTDSGNSFSHADLPFHPMVQIMYNQHDSNVLVVISNKVGLYSLTPV